LRKAAAAVVALLQLAILRGQVKMAVQVVEQLETLEELAVRLLDWELRVKDLTVDYLPSWLHGQAAVAVDLQVSVQLQLTTRRPPEKAEVEHSIRFLALQFAMQPVEVREHSLVMRLVQRVIAAALLHQMVVPERLVQARRLHQLQILVLVVEALVGQQALIWSAETVLVESSSFDMQCQQFQSQHHLPD
jgi:hypothetical protein